MKSYENLLPLDWPKPVWSKPVMLDVTGQVSVVWCLVDGMKSYVYKG